MQSYIHGNYGISKVEWQAFDSASLQRPELQESGPLDSQNDLHGNKNNESLAGHMIRDIVLW